MRKIGGLLLAGIGVFFSVNLPAQGLPELSLLFSRTTPGGSARVMGMGGTQVSLGGDFSSASSNPAGIGMFNRSEFTISPGYSLANAKSTHFDNSVSQSKSNLSIPSLSFAFHSEKNQGSWISGTFAITLTRLNNFNTEVRYEGINPQNSIADFLADDSYGADPSELGNSLGGLAYDNYLIEPDQDLNYFSIVGINHNSAGDVPKMVQRETITTSGAQNQWSASYGVNIDDKFFFGASVHSRSIRFESKKLYGESGFFFVKEPSFSPLDNLSLEEKLKVSGSGYSATLGTIIRPIDGLQVGISWNTPTSYILSDSYTANMATQWNNFDYYGNGTDVLNDLAASTDEILSEYKLKTPARLTIGGTYFFGKSGFVSGEVETVNYSGSKYVSRTSNFSVDEDNATIKSQYRSGVNARLGGEYRMDKFRFRAGAGYLSEPFSEKQNGISRILMNYSAGFGYRTSGFYIDAALSVMAGKNSYRPYSVVGPFSPLVTMKNNMTTFLITLGFPF